MMNQGENVETAASVETNQIIDQPQAHTSYFPPSYAVASWTTQGENHNSRENGAVSNSGYNHSQLPETTVANAQDGSNLASTVSTSSSGSTNVAQGYSGYAAYPNTETYGYNTADYAAYYSQYQQQSSQYQQQPSQYQPQATQYQPQTAQYQPQPQTPQYQLQPQNTQYQPQTNQYQQQPNQSYPHHIGAYQNTGAPHQPLSSFQNTGSYAGSASYSSTYYNPGDYQTSGSYTSSTYGTQANPWQGGQYAAYNNQQYPNYSQDTNSAYTSTNAVATAQYEQHYKQWQDYYNQTQTEVSCAPGTENTSASVSSSVNSSVPSGNIGYTATNDQMPAAQTPLWRPDSSSSELTSVQPVAVSESTHETYWKHGTPSFQNGPPNSVLPPAQKSQEVIPTYGSLQNQQSSTYSQVSAALYPPAYQVSQSHHTSFQTLPQPPELLDSRKTSKLQIPTNPRIASNLSVSISKPNKDNSMTTSAAKPAYIYVATQKPNEEVVPQKVAADCMLKPGAFPKSLRGYVERTLARCKNDRQMAACQAIMKEVITKATADGTLYTKDWDIEPLFPLPNIDGVDMNNIGFQVPTSAATKIKSPSRRAKSRWEPISEEKLADRTTNMNFGAPKYAAWNNKQFSSGETENKVSFSSKFSVTDQKSFRWNTARPAKKQRLAQELNTADGGETSSDSDKEQSLTKYYSAAISLAESPEEKQKRENRSKRFDKGHGTRAEKVKLRVKEANNFYTRRASALVPSKTFEESAIEAVEDMDWDSLTVKGTCQDIEKRYLRLTSAPDPATVRPQEVLEKALEMVQNSQKNYLYKCDQLKSIRQDLTVQRIRNELTVKVYETHGRLAIEAGDLPEYNQCHSQLKTLYAEGISGCHMEFAAYNLLCAILHSNNNRDLVSAMSRLSSDVKKDKAVKHALSVRNAVTSGKYVLFFRLYKTAPNLNTFLMDLYVEKMRYAAVKCISRSCRPTVPVSYISQNLGFSNASLASEARNENELEGVEECIEWLKAHGACLISDSSGETLLDSKASVSSLYMPEPEDAVSHGDANLAVNDFFTRTLP